MLPIGQALYLARVSKGITQAELATRTQIPQANISNIEKGKRDVTVSTLLRMCAALQVSPPSLFQENKHSIPMRRDSLERIAKAVFYPAIRLSSQEKDTAQLLRKQIPFPKGERISSREIYESWFELRRRFSDQEIKALLERVEDARKRFK